MARHKNSPFSIAIAAVITLVTGALLFEAFRDSPLSQPPAADMNSLPPIAPPPDWDGAYPAFVIKPDTLEAAVEREIPTLRHLAPVNQFEVDLHNGLFILRQTDLFVEDSIPLVLTRTYRPSGDRAYAFGKGASHAYDISPQGTRNPYTYMNLVLEDGRSIYYPRISPGTSYTNAVYRHDQTSSEFYNSQVAWNGNGWTVKFADGSQVIFPESYSARNAAQGAPTAMNNAAGRKLTFERDRNRNLTTLTSPAGHTMKFRYDDNARIVEAATDAGAVRRYTYDPTGHLQTVSDGSSVLYQFEYESLIKQSGFDPYLMTSVRDGNGHEILGNRYADGARVSAQILRSGQIFRYRYIFDAEHNVKEAFVRMPDGKTTRISF